MCSGSKPDSWWDNVAAEWLSSALSVKLLLTKIHRTFPVSWLRLSSLYFLFYFGSAFVPCVLSHVPPLRLLTVPSRVSPVSHCHPCLCVYQHLSPLSLLPGHCMLPTWLFRTLFAGLNRYFGTCSACRPVSGTDLGIIKHTRLVLTHGLENASKVDAWQGNVSEML